MTQVQRAGETLTVDTKIVLWHTVLQIGLDREPSGVAITNNPLEFDKTRVFAQMVMHKTRSHNCAVQVARYVRRTFEIEDAVTTHRATRVVEARVAHVCLNGYQYGPEHASDRYRQVAGHIAATSISELLREVRDGHNAARIRYIVYELRGKLIGGFGNRDVRLRGVTNKMHSVERMYRQTPPDQMTNVDIVHVGKFETMELARAAVGSFDPPLPNLLWLRNPSIEYLRRILRIEGDDIVFVSDGTCAVRPYDTPSVVIGPHVYTESSVRNALVHGKWVDLRRTEHLHMR